MKWFVFLVLLGACQSSPAEQRADAAAPATAALSVSDSIVPPQFDTAGRLIKVEKSDAEWRQMLPSQAYDVLRHEGTERAFTGAFWDNHRKGTYVCAGCGLPLFSSDAKFESGTGWPSFTRPIQKEHVALNTDNSYGMRRVEVECARCGGHQGHVFEDGPPPTGMRYCINSVSLAFVPAP